MVVSALLPPNSCTSRGNPSGSTEPGLDLRVEPVFLAHPDLAQFVSSSRSKCSVVTS